MSNHEIPVICPHCKKEYDAHLDWTICPYCGYDRDPSKYRIVGQVGLDKPFIVQQKINGEWVQVGVFEEGEIGLEQARFYIHQMTNP